MEPNDQRNTRHAVIVVIIALVLLVLCLVLVVQWLCDAPKPDSVGESDGSTEASFAQQWNDGFESAMGFFFDWTEDFGKNLDRILYGGE